MIKVLLSILKRDDYMKTNDLRVIKTKKALFNALIELMKNKTFEEIKVSDICTKALINRTTFYAHYDDKYELLSDCITNIKEELSKELAKNTSISNTKEYYIEMIKLFLDHIEDKKDTYLAIAINNKNSILTDILYDAIDHDIILHLNNDNSFSNKDIPSEIIAKFYLVAVTNIAITWIQNLNKYTKEDIINYLNTLIPDEI